MLEFFRNNRRGVVGLFVVGMCVFLMLPFGLDYFQRKPGADIVVTVGDKKITEREYYTEVERVKSIFKRQFGAQYEQFEKMINVKQKVLDEMVDKTLLEVFFSKFGFVTSSSQIEAFARSLPAFSGGVDRIKFQSFLKSQGITESEFEKTVKEKLAEDQLSSLLGSAALYGKEEREARFKRKEAKLGLFYSKVTPQENNIKIEASKVEEYYQANKSRYMTDRKVLPLVVRFSPERYVASVKVEEEEIAELYKSSQAKFSIPRKVKYETLSFLTSKSALAEMIEGSKPDEAKDEKVKVLAEELKKNLDLTPEKFKELGQEKGAIYKIEKDLASVSDLSVDIKNVIQGLKVNEVSSVFKVGEEVSLIRIVEEVPSSVRPYEEVKEELKREIISSLTPEYAKVASENFLRSVEDKAFQEREATVRKLSEEQSLILEESSEGVSNISDIDLPSLKQIIDASKGYAAIVPSKNGSSYVFIYVKDIIEPKEKDYQSVKPDIEMQLKAEAMLKQSKERASSLLATFKDLQGGASVKAGALRAELSKLKLKIEEVAPAKREALAINFIDDPKVKSQVISEVEANGYYKEPYSSYTGDVYLIGLTGIEVPKNEDVSKEMESFLAKEQKAVSSSILSQLINNLKSEIKPVVADSAGL